MNEVKQSIRVSRKELEEMTAQERVDKYGYDPLGPGDEPWITKSTIVMTFAILGLVIGGTIFALSLFVQPGTVPIIDRETFELPVSEETTKVAAFRDARESWTEQNHGAFQEAADRLLDYEPIRTDTAAIKELNLYKLRSYLLNDQLDTGNQFARSLQGRYQSDLIYLSDLYYYRGHIIIRRDGLKASIGAFSESCALGGRYSEESCVITRRIERMNRPLW